MNQVLEPISFDIEVKDAEGKSTGISYNKKDLKAGDVVVTPEQARNINNANIIMMGARALIKQRNYNAAFELALLALQQYADHAEAHNAVGICIRQDGEYEQALDAFQEAMRLAPDSPIYPANRAALLIDGIDLQKGLEEMRPIVAANPTLDVAQMSLTVGELAAGNFEAGWKLYRSRMKHVEWARQIATYRLPIWDGKEKHGVLIVQEEGPGERLMFASMIQDVIDAGAHPIIEIHGAHDSMAGLFARSFPKATIATQGMFVRPNSQIVAGDMGGMFRPSFDAFPWERPGYLVADKQRTHILKHKIREAAKGKGGPIIGLSWHSKGVAYGKTKSVDFKELWLLFSLFPDAIFVDLQYGDTTAERLTVPMMVHLDDVDITSDWDDLASLVKACDLVISISNSVAHLAGALGVKTWVMLPGANGLNWFWFRDRDTSPWYPTARLFRRAWNEKSWTPVVDNVIEALRGFCNERYGDGFGGS